MTLEEWDKLWWQEFGRLRRVSPTTDIARLSKVVTLWMNRTYGRRPSATPGLSLKAKFLALIGGSKMGNILKLVSRFGPLIAAFLVGLVGVIPGADSILQGIVAGLGFLGITPDADTAAQWGNLVASALLLYGSVIKFYRLVKSKLNPTPPTP